VRRPRVSVPQMLHRRGTGAKAKKATKHKKR
jgi:hypothetical protein